MRGAVLFICLFGWVSNAAAGPVLVDFLDIGQGDAILIRTPEKTALIDAGDKSSNTEDQLRELGVYRIDLLIATHPHADHIGRMPQVVSQFDIGLYMDNGMPHTTGIYTDTMQIVEDREIPYKTARNGQRLNFGDDVTFDVLFPSEPLLTETRSDWNSNSVVVRMVHDDVTMLFTGDAEEPTELALLDAGLEPVNLLKVAHHGSRHSTRREFLDAVDPDIAVISCGRRNRFDHPGTETLDRLKDAEVTVYRTDLSYNVRALSDGTTIQITKGPLSRIGSGLVDLGLADEVVSTGPVAIPRGAAEPLVLDEKERRKAAKAEEKRRRKAEKARKKAKWPMEAASRLPTAPLERA